MSDDGASLYDELLAGRVSRAELLRRGAAAGLGAPALAAILAACGGGSSSSTGSGSSAAGTVPEVGTAVTTPAPTGELDQLKWGLFYEPGPLDWIYDYNYEENTVVTNITESLMRLTPQLTIEPGLERELRRQRSEEHTSELQSQFHLVCRLLLEKKKTKELFSRRTPPTVR